MDEMKADTANADLAVDVKMKSESMSPQVTIDVVPYEKVKYPESSLLLLGPSHCRIGRRRGDRLGSWPC